MSGLARRESTVGGGVPRVNLLPPEVAQRARDQSALSWSLLLLVVVVGLIAAGVGFAALRTTTAQASLTSAQSQGMAILAEQQEYIEIRDVNAAILLSEEACVTTMSTEVLWSDLLAVLLAAAPEGSVVKSIGGSVPTPWNPVAEPTSPLDSPSVGTVQLTISMVSLEDLANFARAVEKIDFVSAVSIDSVVEPGPHDGTFTIALDAEALALRFAADEGGQG